MTKPLKNLVLAAALVTTVGSSVGCVMSPRTAVALGSLATTAVYAAAIVGTVAILAHHDAHYHYETCGHYRQYHEGRWVYQYGGHWEYYDSYSGTWYYYQ
jgi:hypothetical protein